jgi:hypothetical protein
LNPRYRRESIGAGDWYRVSKWEIENGKPIEAARSVAQAPYWENEIDHDGLTETN